MVFSILWLCTSGIGSELLCLLDQLSVVAAADHCINMKTSGFQIQPDGSVVATVDLSYDTADIPHPFRMLMPSEIVLSGIGCPFSRNGIIRLIGVPNNVKGDGPYLCFPHPSWAVLHKGQHSRHHVLLARALKKGTGDKLLSASKLPDWVWHLQIATEYQIDLPHTPTLIYLPALVTQRVYCYRHGFDQQGPLKAQLLGSWVSRSAYIEVQRAR